MKSIPLLSLASLAMLTHGAYAQNAELPPALPSDRTPTDIEPVPVAPSPAVPDQAGTMASPTPDEGHAPSGVGTPSAVPGHDDYGPAAISAPTELPNASKGPGLNVTASFFTRYELREGYDDIGRVHPRYRESDFVFYRARLGLSTTPVDVGNGRDVVLLFEPQASGFWADKAGTLADGAVGMHQAMVRISGDSYSVDAGRFELSYGDELVIGSVGWHQTGRSFDGLRSRINLSKGWVDVFATQVLEDPFLVKPYGAGDQYFGGVYAGLGPMLGERTEFDAYVLSQVRPRISVDTELGLQLTAGTRLKRSVGRVDMRAEIGAQWGTGSLEQIALQGDAEVGTRLGKTRMAAGGWYASGDDPTTVKNEAWDELYPTAHKFMGLADIIGPRTNIMGGALRVRHKLESVGLGADANLFLRPETLAGVDAYTGLELDAWAVKQLGKGLGLRGGYSLFAPNDAGPFGTSDLAHYVEVQLAFAIK